MLQLRYFIKTMLSWKWFLNLLFSQVMPKAERTQPLCNILEFQQLTKCLFFFSLICWLISSYWSVIQDHPNCKTILLLFTIVTAFYVIIVTYKGFINGSGLCSASSGWTHELKFLISKILQSIQKRQELSMGDCTEKVLVSLTGGFITHVT